VISQVKLIAEPWTSAREVTRWANFGRVGGVERAYRDVARRYWKGDDGQLTGAGYRLTGSSDLYQRDSRHPSASINFITAHDGFTLEDLVSYNEKHNEANLEDNRDGAKRQSLVELRVEGLPMIRKILELRERQKRNFLATLLLSQGSHDLWR